MAKVALIANRSMRYNTRRLVAGDVFDARPKDAKLLVLVNRADVYVPPVKAKGRKREERVEEVAPVEEPVVPEPVEIALDSLPDIGVTADD